MAMDTWIHKETFDSANIDTKLGMLHDGQVALINRIDCILAGCSKRRVDCNAEMEDIREGVRIEFEEIRSSNKEHRLAKSAQTIGGGIVGGFLAMIAKFTFWK